MADKSAVVVGVGASRGLGAAIARRFAREKFRVTVMGRSAEKLEAAWKELRETGAKGRAVVGDVTDEALLRRVVAEAERRGAARGRDLQRRRQLAARRSSTWTRRSSKTCGASTRWRASVRQGRARGDAAAPARRAALHRRQRVAARQAKFGGFAQAKAALRAIAQSAAREFGPQGIHVAHVIVDGAIDGDRINTFLPSLKEQRGADGLLDPDAIAENFWTLYQQPRSAWTHELDVRPWVENW